MTTELRRALAALADDAGDYVDAGRAVAAARRSRTVRWAAGSAVLLMLALAAGVGVVRLGDPDRGPQTADRPGLTVDVLGPAPAFPADGIGNARATVVFDPCARSCETRIVLDDGRQLSLPEGSVRSPRMLSPDGRWLAWDMPDAGTLTTILDLSTGQQRNVAGLGMLISWTPDSSRLFGRGLNPVAPVAADPVTGDVVPVQMRTRTATALAYAGNDILEISANVGGAIIHKPGGATVTVDWGSLVGTGESAYAEWTGLFQDPGGQLVIPIGTGGSGTGEGSAFSLTGFLIVDWADPGGVRRVRTDLPRGITRAATVDGIVVERWTPVDSDSYTVHALDVVDPRSGAVRPYLTFTAGVEAGVALPGGR